MPNPLSVNLEDPEIQKSIAEGLKLIQSTANK